METIGVGRDSLTLSVCVFDGVSEVFCGLLDDAVLCAVTAELVGRRLELSETGVSEEEMVEVFDAEDVMLDTVVGVLELVDVDTFEMGVGIGLMLLATSVGVVDVMERGELASVALELSGTWDEVVTVASDAVVPSEELVSAILELIDISDEGV